MRTIFHPDALAHLAHWIGEDPKTAARILVLIEDARRHPFTGLGKPEPLRGNFKGWWSRRISEEHRLVYRVTGSGAAQTIEIVQCKFHYS